MTTQARPRGKLATSIHPKKLLHSKWTAVTPIARQRHFIVTQVLALMRRHKYPAGHHDGHAEQGPAIGELPEHQPSQ